MQNFQTIDILALDTVIGGAETAPEKKGGWLEAAKGAAKSAFGGGGGFEVNVPVTTGQGNKVQAGGEGNSIR